VIPAESTHVDSAVHNETHDKLHALSTDRMECARAVHGGLGGCGMQTREREHER
jgi:hypothetical protein